MEEIKYSKEIALIGMEALLHDEIKPSNLHNAIANFKLLYSTLNHYFGIIKKVSGDIKSLFILRNTNL